MQVKFNIEPGTITVRGTDHEIRKLVAVLTDIANGLTKFTADTFTKGAIIKVTGDTTTSSPTPIKKKIAKKKTTTTTTVAPVVDPEPPTL